MNKYSLSFILVFILTSCFSQKNEITKQDLFNDFLESEELKNHFKFEKEIYILRDKSLCEKIDCDKTYFSEGKKVNIWERADYFSRNLRDYAIITKIDNIKNKVDFYFHK